MYGRGKVGCRPLSSRPNAEDMLIYVEHALPDVNADARFLLAQIGVSIVALGRELAERIMLEPKAPLVEQHVDLEQAEGGRSDIDSVKVQTNAATVGSEADGRVRAAKRLPRALDARNGSEYLFQEVYGVCGDVVYAFIIADGDR